MRLALVTNVLGHQVSSVLGSPHLIFAKSVSACSGPRFSFIRKRMPEKARRWSPSTLLRSTDKVKLSLLKVLKHIQDTRQVFQDNGVKQHSTSACCSVQDFSRIVGVPHEQYQTYKKGWQAEHKRRQGQKQ